MSSIVNSFVNDKLRNDQLVLPSLIHPSLKQDIVKQMSIEHCIDTKKIERIMLCVFLFYLTSPLCTKSDTPYK